jgi:2',3'-cyclic-nucleotide 2'-phosphodiesterase (5'-nucleotidase family)
MSYEVYDDYKDNPRYMDFRSELHEIVKQMKQLKKDYYNKVKVLNHLSINDNAYMTNHLDNDAYMDYLNHRQNILNRISKLERKYGIYSDAPFTRGYC